MTAPERIWAVHHETHGAVMIGEWADTIRHLGGVEYVHIDLHDATKAQLAKAVEALRDMVDHADEISSPLIAARAVLAEIEKGGV
jgi:hypothetical protein